MPQEGQAQAALKTTAFSFQDPAAKAVFLAGTFNDWDPSAIGMERSLEGRWTVELRLKPGRYEYKFIVDGEWCCHPGCGGHESGGEDCVANVFGTFNRLIEVVPA